MTGSRGSKWETIDTTKPFKGSIRDWKFVKLCSPTEEHTGEYIRGVPVGHPEFINYIRTSMVVAKKDSDGYWEVETLNSRYHLDYNDEEPDREFWDMS